MSAACGVCCRQRKSFCCVRCVTDSIHAKRMKIDQLKKENDLLKLRVTTLLEQKKFTADYQAQERRNHLQRKADIQQAILRRKDAVVACKRYIVDKQNQNKAQRNELIKSTQALQQIKKEQLDICLKPLIETLSWHYIVFSKALSQLRRHLVHDIQKLLPLEVAPSTEIKICNLSVPYDCTTLGTEFPPEHAATALGTLVHLLQITSAYLGVTLPHRISFKGSRSTITKSQSNEVYILEPLHPEFENALACLAYNVEALCFQQGALIPESMRMHVFANVVRLLQCCPTLGSVGPYGPFYEPTEGDIYVMPGTRRSKRAQGNTLEESQWEILLPPRPSDSSFSE
eukprot:GFYU01003390.1.p1 GENE.GFYU01003390.1~~GFYU01003390.1.p1  ORF type:complete len:343 (+),score=51.76 GFYU01003390.1:99-1127(+)